MGGRRFKDKLQIKTFGILQREGFGKLLQNLRPLLMTRLWRRFSQVEKLPTPQRKQITQILDAFLEREKLKKAS